MGGIKMIKKRLSCIALLLAAAMSFTACGAKGSSSSSSSASSAASGTPTELTVAFFTFGETPKDLTSVQDEINKISLAKINTKVKLLPVSIGAWSQQINLMLSSGEKLDLFSLQSALFSGNVAKGQIIPLDDLLNKYGQGIKQAVGEEYLKGSQINGKTYGVTSIRDLAAGTALSIRKDYVDKYHIDTTNIKTFEDIEQVLKTIKEKEPNITPLLMYNSKALTPVELNSGNDKLGDGFGQLLNKGSDLKVVDWYETPRYAEMLNTVRKWYNAGYIMKDAATNTQAPQSLVKASKGVSYFAATKPGIMTQETRATGTEMVALNVVSPYATTSNVQIIQWGIAQNSKEPAKSMQFLNLMYTDKNIINLFDYGIEGKHYAKETDGTINFPQGVDAKTSGYNLGLGWMFGNEFLSYVWKGDSPDIWKQMADFNKTSTKSKAMGFTFDSSSVKTEIAALSSVTDQYKVALETGSMDPKLLTDFISKLKTAGIDKLVAEKQKQLDAWAKNNK
jgi:putative aldouronate transport system substrate-binding protein